MRFGPYQALELLILGQNWGQLGRKCCDWLKIPSMIPIPGFMIRDCEPNSTLECFCISLQSCRYVIWAILALKLSVFCKIWGQLGTNWCVWIEEPCTVPIPGFINLMNKPRLTLECFRSNLQPFAHVI